MPTQLHVADPPGMPAGLPPEITIVSMPSSVAARTAFAVSTSATASWNDAATSSTGMARRSRSRFSTPRATAVLDSDLIRTKVSLVPEHVAEVRVVDIVGLDKQADGGTHVHTTGEVGRVRVVKTESKGKGNKRIRVEVVDA